MAGLNTRHGVITSPNSSEEHDSNQATPATKLSNFSPNDICETLKTGNTGIVRSKVPPAFILTHTPQYLGQGQDPNQNAVHAVQDPFVSGPSLSATTQSSTDTSKLSPIATSFTPQSIFTSNSTSSVTLSEQSGSVLIPAQLSEGLHSKFPGFGTSSGIVASTPFRFRSKLEATSPSTKEAFDQQNDSIVSATPPKRGSFSTDNGASRCLMVTQVAKDCPAAAIESFFSPGTFGSLKKIVFKELIIASTVYVQFGDMRDVMKAADSIEYGPWGWSVHFFEPINFAIKASSEYSASSPVSNYEAQVIVTVKSLPAQQPPKIEQELSEIVYNALSQSGDIMALEEVHSTDPNHHKYRAEFFSSDAVDRLLIHSTWLEVNHFLLNIARHEPDLQVISRQSSDRVGPLIIGEEELDIDSALQKLTISSKGTTSKQEMRYSTSFPLPLDSTPISRSLTMRKDLGGLHTPSPLTQSYNSCDRTYPLTSPFWSPTYGNGSDYRFPSSIWSSGSPGAIGQERGAMISPGFGSFHQKSLGNGTVDLQQQRNLYKGVRRHNEHSIGTHNVVDINRIRIGLDVRTTIMLRNIPNKMTSAVLKGILDETSFGKYDFTYLRIDFANNCNVGYAFINFEDPIHIVNFVNARAGRRWNCYNSDKVAEISYATIQGRDCLIQKFRNSSVMLEQPSSRPKIWSTSGLTIGQEEPFPGPDNPSKMRRSVENAEHVGLFAPRAGQNFRDEQRRRRSQYDRGTRLAEIEESYDTTTYQYRDRLNPIAPQMPSAVKYPQEHRQMYCARRAGSF